jgi:glutamine amidotransferase
MTVPKVRVVDYGVGNLYSIGRALEYCGASVEIASSSGEINSADSLLLPGMGAFADGMKGLRERGLADAIVEYAQTQRPLLGICLGMQMLAHCSEEFGKHGGLGLIPGRVVAVPSVTTTGRIQKVPHVGWSDLQIECDSNQSMSPLRELPAAASVYFVHSYHFVTDYSEHLLATYSYGGHRLAAAVRKDNILGLQFHPEKSGNAGLTILRSFLEAL